MMNRNFLVGKFWDPEAMMSALKELHHDGVQVYDVFSPFPIHGIEPYLDIKRTRLSVASFIYGGLGMLCALALIIGIYGFIWPMNIGGKPAVGLPSFVPITFEMTVLFAAHGMVITFFIVTRYWPGKAAKLFDDRQTDDVFIIAVDKEKVDNPDEIAGLMNRHGAYIVTQQDREI